MNITRSFSLLALSGLFVTSACTMEVIEGSGRSATEVRETRSFNAVTNSSLLDVEILAGEEQLVEITCDHNLLDYIRTQVDDGVLEVYQPTVVDEPNHFVSLEPRSPCRALVVAPVITEVVNAGSGNVAGGGEMDTLSLVEATGSGDVELEGLDAAHFDLRLDGSGDVAVGGIVSNLSIELNGSGSALARELTARDATVELDGSGSVEITATGQVEITINGSGDVTVHGRPDSCRVRTPGSGQVIFE